MVGDESPVGFQHAAGRVEDVVAAITALVEEGERTYFRTRDLDVDGSNAVIGAVLALIADQPDAVEEQYGIDVCVTLDRYAEQPAGIVWEVRRR